MTWPKMGLIRYMGDTRDYMPTTLFQPNRVRQLGLRLVWRRARCGAAGGHIRSGQSTIAFIRVSFRDKSSKSLRRREVGPDAFGYGWVRQNNPAHHAHAPGREQCLPMCFFGPGRLGKVWVMAGDLSVCRNAKCAMEARNFLRHVAWMESESTEVSRVIREVKHVPMSVEMGKISSLTAVTLRFSAPISSE